MSYNRFVKNRGKRRTYNLHHFRELVSDKSSCHLQLYYQYIFSGFIEIYVNIRSLLSGSPFFLQTSYHRLRPERTRHIKKKKHKVTRKYAERDDTVINTASWAPVSWLKRSSKPCAITSFAD